MMDLQQRQIELEATSLIHDIDNGNFNVKVIKGFLLRFATTKKVDQVKKTRKEKEQEMMASYISSLGKPTRKNRQS